MKNKENLSNYIWLFMFCILFVMPNIASILFLNKGEEVELENSDKSSLPVWTWESHNEYSSQFESYYNDNLPFKETLVKINGIISFFGFGESPSDRVIVGKDGWLFYEDTVADYKRTNLYTEQELADILEKLCRTEEYLQEQGCELYIFIAPNKASIYGTSSMPAYIRRDSGISRTEQVVAYVKENSDINIIYPEEELKNVIQRYPEYPLYMHLDTHWNYLGGYLGTRSLLNAMGKAIPELEV